VDPATPLRSAQDDEDVVILRAVAGSTRNEAPHPGRIPRLRAA
jgi:hypothetical protein